MDLSGCESGSQKIAGRAEGVISKCFFRVQKIDKQTDEEEPEQEGQDKDLLDVSHGYSNVLNIQKLGKMSNQIVELF